MRALAHPVRMALMEELAVAGQLTATQAAQLVGESPANCSFHLRQLAKYGFVEETGNGHGRNRPWKLKTTGMTLRTAEQHESETAIAMSTLSMLFWQRAIERLRRWWDTEAVFPKPWRQAAQSKQTIWWVTPDELEALGEELFELLLRYNERAHDPSQRPDGAAPVEFLAFAYPLQMPAVPEVDQGAAEKDQG